MGRLTYEDMYKSLGPVEPDAQILPHRDSFVISSDPNYKGNGVKTMPSIRKCVESLDLADKRKIFVIGGERIYNTSLPWTNTVYMSIVKDKTYDCDRFFDIKYLQNNFVITGGEETDELYHTVYQRIRKTQKQRGPQRR